MAIQPPDLPPRELDPAERDLARRSGQAALAPWLITAAVVLLAALAFIVWARG
jgi:hypothetical protein